MKLAVLILAWLVVAAMLFVLCRRGLRKYRETGSLWRERPLDPRHAIIMRSDGLFWFQLTGCVLGAGGAFCVHLYFRIGLPLLAAGLLMHAIGSAVRRRRRATEL